VPDAKAEWAYGWDVWDIVPYEKARKAVWKADMVARIKELGVQELGRISHGEIAELYRRASIFVYPTEFAEIDCISLSKGMAAGAIPITTDFAAMGNKSHHGGVFLHSKKTKDNWYTPEKLHYGVIDPELKAQFVREGLSCCGILRLGRNASRCGNGRGTRSIGTRWPTHGTRFWCQARLWKNCCNEVALTTLPDN
jgi:glycosyltransferase involved in cell wall biosynthesis